MTLTKPMHYGRSPQAGNEPARRPVPVSTAALLLAGVVGLVLLTGCTVGHHGLQWFWAPDPPHWTGTTNAPAK